VRSEDDAFAEHRKLIADLAIQHRLAAVGATTPPSWVAGGLMASGADIRDIARRTGIFVDKLLKGGQPRLICRSSSRRRSTCS
jgi:hypothetical protein